MEATVFGEEGTDGSHNGGERSGKTGMTKKEEEMIRLQTCVTFQLLSVWHLSLQTEQNQEPQNDTFFITYHIIFKIVQY